MIKIWVLKHSSKNYAKLWKDIKFFTKIFARNKLKRVEINHIENRIANFKKKTKN